MVKFEINQLLTSNAVIDCIIVINTKLYVPMTSILALIFFPSFDPSLSKRTAKLIFCNLYFLLLQPTGRQYIT